MLTFNPQTKNQEFRLRLNTVDGGYLSSIEVATPCRTLVPLFGLTSSSLYANGERLSVHVSTICIQQFNNSSIYGVCWKNEEKEKLPRKGILIRHLNPS